MSGKYLQVAQQFIKLSGARNRFAKQSGAGTVRPLIADEGRLKVEFEVSEEMTNPFGTLHGGCTATLIDVYTTGALLCSEKAEPGVSVDLHVTYMAAAKIGDTVVMDSLVTKRGRSLAFTKAELYRKSDNTLIATGVHTKAFPKMK